MPLIKKSAPASAAVFVFLALLWTGAAAAASDTGETLHLSPGAVKTIALSENPSTGYRWQINKGQSSNLAIVQVSDAGYQRSSSDLIGAAGTHRWRIKALAAGTAQIVFDYSRSWEHGVPARRHTILVEINLSR